MKMSLIGEFIADFTSDQIIKLSKTQQFIIAILNRDEYTIRKILSIVDEKFVIKDALLREIMRSNFSNDLLSFILLYPHHEYEPSYILRTLIIIIIRDGQDIKFYDAVYEKYLKKEQNVMINVMFFNTFQHRKTFEHSMKTNRICFHQTFLTINFDNEPERKSNLMKCGLMRSDENDLFDDQGQSKVPVNNLFMRCCADGRIDDVRRIINSHKTKK